jgi:hypothetical protein
MSMEAYACTAADADADVVDTTGDGSRTDARDGDGGGGDEGGCGCRLPEGSPTTGPPLLGAPLAVVVARRRPGVNAGRRVRRGRAP